MKTGQRSIVAALAAVNAMGVGVGMAADDGTLPRAQPNVGVRTASVVVAAADAPDHVKAAADVVCAGTDDHQFTIRVDAPPGKGDAAFHWRAVTTRAQTLGSTP